MSGVTPPVDAIEDAVAEGDVVGQLVQLAIYGHLSCVVARVGTSESPLSVSGPSDWE